MLSGNTGVAVRENKMTLAPLKLKQFLDIIEAVSDEFRLKIYKDGWKVGVVDPANIAIIKVDLPSAEFINYEYDWTDEEIKIGIDTPKTKDFLTGASEQEDVMVGSELDEPVDLSFSLAPEKDQVYGGKEYGDRYKLYLRQGIYSREMLAIPQGAIRKEPKIPELSLPYMVTLNTQEMRRIIRKAQKVSDYTRFRVKRNDDGVLKFTAVTEDENELPLLAEPDVHVTVSPELGTMRPDYSSLFGLEYLHDIVKVIPTERVCLHIGNDHPIKLDFDLGTTGKVTYMQAPRIESE